MKCQKCKQKIEDNSKFCVYCGCKKVEEESKKEKELETRSAIKNLYENNSLKEFVLVLILKTFCLFILINLILKLYGIKSIYLSLITSIIYLISVLIIRWKFGNYSFNFSTTKLVILVNLITVISLISLTTTTLNVQILNGDLIITKLWEGFAVVPESIYSIFIFVALLISLIPEYYSAKHKR